LASEPANSTWIAWLLAIVLFSALIAACVGFLKALDGSPVIDAVLAAGAAFGGLRCSVWLLYPSSSNCGNVDRKG
jgi:hypothetical protein